MESLPKDTRFYNEFCALIVKVGRENSEKMRVSMPWDVRFTPTIRNNPNDCLFYRLYIGMSMVDTATYCTTN
jgi:hypothetical protein